MLQKQTVTSRYMHYIIVTGILGAAQPLSDQ